jgi:hypothetical protein
MASWLLTGVAFAQQSNAALLTIDAQRDSTVHEPVQIDVAIVNLTKEPIVFKLGQDRDLKWAMSFTGTDPFGDVPVPPLILSPDDLAIARIPHGTPESLAPGDSFHGWNRFQKDGHRQPSLADTTEGIFIQSPSSVAQWSAVGVLFQDF